jgi:hypothetical protein
MVYTGKPSRGCAMCKSRRIKVRNSAPNFILGRTDLRVCHSAWSRNMRLDQSSLENPTDELFLFSVMNNVRYVANVRSLEETVPGIRTNSTLSFEMRIKPWSGRLGRALVPQRPVARRGLRPSKCFPIRFFLASAARSIHLAYCIRWL